MNIARVSKYSIVSVFYSNDGKIVPMLTLLEITGDDIALLSDTVLRSLIGLLCEADFRLAGLPTNGIIWGGHQDASDDGMDVTVHGDVDPPQNSRVPRKTTGFQVKKPDMQPSRIGKEMRPKGKLREEIKALINLETILTETELDQNVSGLAKKMQGNVIFERVSFGYQGASTAQAPGSNAGANAAGGMDTDGLVLNDNCFHFSSSVA